MGPRLFKGALHRPARHDPLRDLLRGGVHIGTEEGGIRQFALRVPHQDKANGHRGQARGLPQRGAREDPKPFALTPAPVHDRLLPWRIRAGSPAL